MFVAFMMGHHFSIRYYALLALMLTPLLIGPLLFEARRAHRRISLSRIKWPEVDGPAHLKIACRRRMNSVAVVVRSQQVGVGGAAHDLVEIDHPIKTSALANPVVDLVFDLCLRIVPAGIAGLGRAIVPGDDGYAEDLDAFRLHARSYGAHAIDNLGRRCFAADIVSAHEQHDVTHPGMRKHIAVEPVEARRAVGWTLVLIVLPPIPSLTTERMAPFCKTRR